MPIAIVSVLLPPELRSCGTCGQATMHDKSKSEEKRTATRRVGSVESPSDPSRQGQKWASSLSWVTCLICPQSAEGVMDRVAGPAYKLVLPVGSPGLTRDGCIALHRDASALRASRRERLVVRCQRCGFAADEVTRAIVLPILPSDDERLRSPAGRGGCQGMPSYCRPGIIPPCHDYRHLQDRSVSPTCTDVVCRESCLAVQPTNSTYKLVVAGSIATRDLQGAAR